MQTVRYYRDYAQRARRLRNSVDRLGIRETLETLASGFDEIATALETGMLSPLPPEHDPQAGCTSQTNRSRAIDGPAYFFSPTRH